MGHDFVEGEEIAAELEVSVATLYNWRRQYGGMDTDAAKELRALRDQNARLKWLLADAELRRTRCGRSRREILSPATKRRAVDMLKQVKGLSERFACKVVGLHRATYRRLPVAQSRRRHLGSTQLQPAVAPSSGPEVRVGHSEDLPQAVASLDADQYTAQHLGHANDSVPKRHYIDHPSEAPDFTAALGRLAG
ncbi:transposase [Nocardia sp. NPDC004604]|uniref:transposase n=1 Tax=Nocardia sp. NPDC004604 TaxID=3157013 RepID=UPI0033A27081